MHRLFTAIFIAVSSFAFVQIASAADVPVKAPAPAPAIVAYNWTGFYVGVHGGVAAGLNADASSITLSGGISSTDPVRFDGTSHLGAVGGFHVGYNWQLHSSWVIGAELDFSWASLSNRFRSGTLSFGGVPFPPNNFVTMDMHLNWLASARGRVGYARDKLLLYVTGGAAWANLDYSASRNYAAIPPNNIASLKDTSPGWVIGVGTEYAATNWILRAEYLYYSFASSQSALTVCQPFCGITPAVVLYNWDDASVHVGRVGLSYKF